MKHILTAALLAALAMPISALTDEAWDNWNALPEHQDLAVACAHDLAWATDLVRLKHQGASPIAALRYAEQKAEEIGKQAQDETFSIGVSEALLPMIGALWLTDETYYQPAGGFAQFAYRSCLKDKPFK